MLYISVALDGCVIYMLQCLRKAKIKTTGVLEFGYQSCPSFVHQYSFVWDATRMGRLIHAFVSV